VQLLRRQQGQQQRVAVARLVVVGVGEPGAWQLLWQQSRLALQQQQEMACSLQRVHWLGGVAVAVVTG